VVYGGMCQCGICGNVSLWYIGECVNVVYASLDMLQMCPAHFFCSTPTEYQVVAGDEDKEAGV
jgi:hypothetical protein